MDETSPLLMTPPQAARQLGIHPGTLRRMAAAGRIGHTSFGPQTIRFTQQHLLDFIERNSVKPTVTEPKRIQPDPELTRPRHYANGRLRVEFRTFGTA